MGGGSSERKTRTKKSSLFLILLFTVVPSKGVHTTDSQYISEQPDIHTYI